MDVTRHNAAVIKAPSGHFSQPCHVPRTMMDKHIRAVSAMSLSFMDADTNIATQHKRACCATLTVLVFRRSSQATAAIGTMQSHSVVAAC